METAEIIKTILDLGFPVFTSVYLMIYMNKQQQEMRDTINELKNAINILTENLKEKNYGQE